MPSLPRIKRSRARGLAGEVVAQPEPRVSELTADELTWIHNGLSGRTVALGR